MAKLTHEQQAAYDAWLDAFEQAWDERQPALISVRQVEAAVSRARAEYMRLEDELREARAALHVTRSHINLRRATAEVRRVGVPFPTPGD